MKTMRHPFRYLRGIKRWGYRFSVKCYQRLSVLSYQLGILFFLLSVWRVALADDNGDDYLSDAKSTVDATFGASSTFIHFIYLAEVASIMLLFNKNKNPLILVSLPILLIATKYFFGKIGS